MMRRGVVLGMALIGLGPALAGAQGLQFEHKAVACIVAGKYPKMNACFAPRQNFARGRVYFRAEGTTAW